MIQTDTPIEITYNAFMPQIIRDGNTIALVITDLTNTAHIFPMDVPHAADLENKIAQARSGIEIATAMPNGNGAPSA